jgi:hypothetical protein
VWKPKFLTEEMDANEASEIVMVAKDCNAFQAKRVSEVIKQIAA